MPPYFSTTRVSKLRVSLQLCNENRSFKKTKIQSTTKFIHHSCFVLYCCLVIFFLGTVTVYLVSSISIVSTDYWNHISEVNKVKKKTLFPTVPFSVRKVWSKVGLPISFLIQISRAKISDSCFTLFIIIWNNQYALESTFPFTKVIIR